MMIVSGDKTVEKVPSAPPAASDQPTNLSQHVFSDPRDFLKTIQDNFKELAHGHSVISDDDLKSDMKLGSTEQVRAAGTIAEQHFSDLAQIAGGDGSTVGISKDDLNYATKMNDHEILGMTIANVATDSSMALGGFVAGAIGLTAGIDGLGASAVAAGAGAFLPSLAIGVGVAGVGLGILGAYTAAREYSNLSKDSNAEAAKFKSWM